MTLFREEYQYVIYYQSILKIPISHTPENFLILVQSTRHVLLLVNFVTFAISQLACL